MVLGSLKEIYFSWEDKYYHFLDSLDSRGIPVYKIVGPLDKVFPTFALLLIIALKAPSPMLLHK